MQLFYNPTLDNSAKQFIFPPDESKHIVRVLRKSEGDTVHITNGKGYLFEAEILEADQKNVGHVLLHNANQFQKDTNCIWWSLQPK